MSKPTKFKNGSRINLNDKEPADPMRGLEYRIQETPGGTRHLTEASPTQGYDAGSLVTVACCPKPKVNGASERPWRVGYVQRSALEHIRPGDLYHDSCGFEYVVLSVEDCFVNVKLI